MNGYNHTGSMIMINAQSYIRQASESIALVYNDSISPGHFEL